jgi:hypothetical protein
MEVYAMAEVPLYFVQITGGWGRASEYLVATADRRFRLKTADLGEAKRFMASLERRGYRLPSHPEVNCPGLLGLPGFGPEPGEIYGGILPPPEGE